MNNCGCILATALLLLACPAAAVDRVTLANGDRLTGTVVRSDGKSLVLETKDAGPVTISWEAVASIEAAEPLHVTLQGGEVLVGPVETEGAQFRVETANAGTVRVGRAAVVSIRSGEEQQAWEARQERLRDPGLLDLWSGFLDVGLSTASGNARTSTFSLGMNAARTTRRDKFSTSFTSLYSSNTTTGDTVVTANAVRGGIRYDMNIRQRAYGFGFTDLEFDEFQKLDLRFVGGGGFGYKAVDGETSKLELYTGGTVNREFFADGSRRTSGELLFGQELSYRVLSITQLREKFAIYPNLTETGSYRMQFDASFVTRINDWLGWQISLSDRFLSNPVPGARKNDVLLTTGIRLTFDREQPQ